MAIPEVTLTIKDGALGIAPDDSSGTQVKIGMSSSGSANVLYEFNDIQTLKDTMGTGPVVDAAALVLATAGGPVLIIKPAGSVAATKSAVTSVQTGTTAVTLTGTARDTYNAKVTIVQGGATVVAGTATFKYTLDNSLTESGEIAVPTAGSYLIPNTGITVVFTYTSGTGFVAGDYFTFTTTAPGFSLAELQTTIDNLTALSDEWALLHVVGAAATVADSASMLTAIDLKMTAAASAFRYAMALIECPEDTDANIKAAFLAVSSTRVAVAADVCFLASAVTGQIDRRSVAWPVAARFSLAPISEDLAYVARGPLTGVNSLDRDENATSGLDTARFITLRTIIGRDGTYITNPRIKCSTGSDFAYIQNRRVMDVACKYTRDSLLNFLNSSVRVYPVGNAKAGQIVEEDARAIESYVESILRTVLTQPQHASDVSVLVDRDANILSTSILPTKVRVVPKGYAKSITVEIGFTNPALAAA